MTELMKRYEAETGCASVAIWRGECTVSDKYIAWLEDQLRWRPVSEKPEEGQKVIGRYNDELPRGLEYTTEEGVQYFIDEDVYVYDITHWLPIPPAPEGE